LEEKRRLLPAKTLDSLVKAKLVTINDNVVISHIGQDIADEMIHFGRIALEKYRGLYE
jgi:hypothetical protein